MSRTGKSMRERPVKLDQNSGWSRPPQGHPAGTPIPVSRWLPGAGRIMPAGAALGGHVKKKKPAATYFPARAVSSAREGLTSVFGMGTGMTPPLWPPANNAVSWGSAPPQARRRPGGAGRGAPREGGMREGRGRNDNMAKPHGLLVLLG